MCPPTQWPFGGEEDKNRGDSFGGEGAIIRRGGCSPIHERLPGGVVLVS